MQRFIITSLYDCYSRGLSSKKELLDSPRLIEEIAQFYLVESRDPAD